MINVQYRLPNLHTWSIVSNDAGEIDEAQPCMRQYIVGVGWDRALRVHNIPHSTSGSLSASC